MERRAVVIAFLFFIMAPGVVRYALAQELSGDSRLAFVPASMLAPIVVPRVPEANLPAAPDDAVVPEIQVAVPIVEPYRRLDRGSDSAVLTSLYATTAIMQALDVHSTLRALDRGGVETNPMLSGLTGNKAAFVVVKGAVAASSIFAARRLAKRNRVAAVATLVAINVAYGLVAHHNYKVAARLR
ncbi:MAG TPA: DUF5658 family protein [Vicinamibacterales bacterium]|nr:DUF5658 family protein [Vicinamibacterales bacterium]